MIWIAQKIHDSYVHDADLVFRMGRSEHAYTCNYFGEIEVVIKTKCWEVSAGCTDKYITVRLCVPKYHRPLYTTL